MAEPAPLKGSVAGSNTSHERTHTPRPTNKIKGGVPFANQVCAEQGEKGCLNPRWVLQLMGFPADYLDGVEPPSKPSATPSSRNARKSSVERSSKQNGGDHRVTVTAHNLDIDKIRIDGGTQPREAIDETAVAEYAEALAAGADLPTVIVFYDGKEYWLADGFHRYHAHRRNGRKDIEADVRRGTKREAVWFSLAANQGHGLRRTNADKRLAIARALEDEEWRGLSDRAIAEHVGVHHDTVATVRREVADSATSTRTGRDGKTYPAPPPPAAETPPPPAAEDSPPPAPKELKATDKLKRTVTEPKAIAAFALSGRFKELVNQAHSLRRAIEELAESKEVGRELAKRLQQAQAECRNIATLVGFCEPYTECPMGDNCGVNCRLCAGDKWITRDQYGALEDGLRKRLES